MAGDGAKLGTNLGHSTNSNACKSNLNCGQISGVDLGEDFGSYIGFDSGFDLGIDLGTDLVSDLGSDLDSDLGTDLGTDIGFDLSTGIDFDPGTDLGCLEGTISCNRFALSRVWYNNNIYLPPLPDDTPFYECISYSPILGYSSDGFKRKEEEGLLDYIVDGNLDFFPCSALFMFWLWNCIDYTLW